MTNTEIIGCAIFALVLIVATWQLGFAFGAQAGANGERGKADKRVNGLLKTVNETRPRKRLVYRKVDPKSVGKKRYLNSKLVGTILSNGEVRA